MKPVIKLLVTAVLLWVVFRSVDFGTVLSLMSRMDPIWACASLFLTALLIVSDAILFSGSLRSHGWRLPFDASLLYSLVSWFFSNLAPSTIGGDLFRGAQVARQGAPVGIAVSSVLAMRLISFTTLFIVMIAGVPVALALIKSSRDAALLGAVVAAAGGALAAVFLLVHLPVPDRILQRWQILRRCTDVAAEFGKLLVPGAQSAGIWGAGLAQNLLRIGVLAALAAALGLNIPLATLFALTPVALLAGMAPISFGGWGMREAAFVYFLGTAGVSGEAALSLSIAFGFLRIFVGAVGGLTWAVVDKERFRIDAPIAQSSTP